MKNIVRASAYRDGVRAFVCLSLAPVLLLSSGCATWRQSGPMKLARKVDIPNGIPWKNEEPREGAPRRMVATWTDAVRQQPGVEAERGFGGRLFFYDRDESSPIRVKGQLVVYAFDETDRLPTDNRPTKRYVFPAEQFARHESDSDLGVSYSVWLPWDKSGGPQTEVSLIARFEPFEGGSLVVSEQTRERLPGVMDGVETMIAGQKQSPVRPAASTEAAAASTAVRNAGYQTPTNSRRDLGPSSAAGMETTTIKLPSRPRRFGD